MDEIAARASEACQAVHGGKLLPQSLVVEAVVGLCRHVQQSFLSSVGPYTPFGRCEGPFARAASIVVDLALAFRLSLFVLCQAEVEHILN